MTNIDVVEVGPAMIYGTWDDTYGNQFVVIWGEAGSTCTVLILSGQDYGGGVSVSSSKVPVDQAEEIIDTLSGYKRYISMERLIMEIEGIK